MSPQAALLVLVGVCVSMQEGLGLPLAEQPGSRDVAPPPRMRSKRCACNNQMDSECHYFCHLDIIWINTPSKTTIYGLGSPLARRRRSVGRCACANPSDRTCASFCLDSSEIPSAKSSAKRARTNLLEVLRAVARVSARLQGLPQREDVSQGLSQREDVSHRLTER